MIGVVDLLLAIGWNIQFSHQGLATTTLWLGVFTTVTGLVLLWMRYGSGPKGLWATAIRWFHVFIGIGMLVYLMGTYWIVPV